MKPQEASIGVQAAPAGESVQERPWLAEIKDEP